MSEASRALILRHWSTANSRDWSQFAMLLHPNLTYEVPQTREYIESAAGYVEMFRTWPGEWQASIKELACEDTKAICVIDFVVASGSIIGISVFEILAGKIAKVTDFWPEPYEPPQRATAAFKRRAE